MLGSANISGPPVLHLLAGDLSHQIEHHLFPDLPSNRHRTIARHVREVLDRSVLTYHCAPLVRQVGNAWHKVLRLSLPSEWAPGTAARSLGRRLGTLGRAGAASASQRRLGSTGAIMIGCSRTPGRLAVHFGSVWLRSP